jgi:hypothetical protein
MSHLSNLVLASEALLLMVRCFITPLLLKRCDGVPSLAITAGFSSRSQAFLRLRFFGVKLTIASRGSRKRKESATLSFGNDRVAAPSRPHESGVLACGRADHSEVCFDARNKARM